MGAKETKETSDDKHYTATLHRVLGFRGFRKVRCARIDIVSVTACKSVACAAPVLLICVPGLDAERGSGYG